MIARYMLLVIFCAARGNLLVYLLEEELIFERIWGNCGRGEMKVILLRLAFWNSLTLTNCNECSPCSTVAHCVLDFAIQRITIYICINIRSQTMIVKENGEITVIYRKESLTPEKIEFEYWTCVHRDAAPVGGVEEPGSGARVSD